MTSAATKVWRGLAVVLLIGALLVGVRAVSVYRSTGELRLSPTAAPPKLQELGRDFRRATGPGSSDLPAGAVRIGSTAGGGSLYRPRLTAFMVRNHVVPTGLWVRDRHGTVWTYELVGGP